mmetsp:Transcript_114995/g.245593  ORF Transcript_114995/g.245593 Transcript_114995/m.245593 type:complete len:257 (+) Transcript_114995:928-1698(+)
MHQEEAGRKIPQDQGCQRIQRILPKNNAQYEEQYATDEPSPHEIHNLHRRAINCIQVEWRQGCCWCGQRRQVGDEVAQGTEVLELSLHKHSAGRALLALRGHEGHPTPEWRLFGMECTERQLKASERIVRVEHILVPNFDAQLGVGTAHAEAHRRMPHGLQSVVDHSRLDHMPDANAVTRDKAHQAVGVRGPVRAVQGPVRRLETLSLHQSHAQCAQLAPPTVPRGHRPLEGVRSEGTTLCAVSKTAAAFRGVYTG